MINTVIIIAAGRGFRIGTLSKNIPKPLIKINGRSFLNRLVNMYKELDFKKIIIVTGYKRKKIEENFINIQNIVISYNKLWESTNSVWSFLEGYKNLNEDIIISYSDILYDGEIIKKLIASKNKFIIPSFVDWKSLWEKRFENPLHDLESFIYKDKTLKEIGNKVSDYSSIMGQFMGLIKIDKNTVEFIMQEYSKKQLKNIDFTNLLNSLISKKIKINVIEYKGFWFEMDKITDLSIIEENLND